VKGIGGVDLDDIAELERPILAELDDMRWAPLVLDRFIGYWW
jgi:hypothetical protein